MTDPVETPPPTEVLAAFDAAGAEPVSLPGGEGRSWLAGDVVLKPVEDETAAAWAAELLARVEEDGFRVARPVATADGRWTLLGWAASRRVEGEPAPRWAEVIRAGDAFHRAVRHEPRPSFFDARDDPWATGDRAAWEQIPIDRSLGPTEEIDRLAAACRPLAGPRDQVIHGDLSGNVLFAEGMAPAVIDLSPYWRPTGFASAIVIADALLWWGAGPEILETAPDVDHLGQLLIRALIYRLVTHAIFHPGAVADPAATRAVDLACGLATVT
jgi:uncharacterized protein (TIGR02569 family)